MRFQIPGAEPVVLDSWRRGAFLCHKEKAIADFKREIGELSRAFGKRILEASEKDGQVLDLSITRP